ncbi:hypothetical protein GCM10009608_74560 [Pseudonocardia alaniniphila]
MTAGPSAGPASAYPMFRTPASTCFTELNDVCVGGFGGVGRASAQPVTDAIDADVTAAATAREKALLFSTPNPDAQLPLPPLTSSPRKQSEFGV